MPTGHLLEMPAYELVRAVDAGAEPGRARATGCADLLQRMAATGLTAGNAMDFDGDCRTAGRRRWPTRWTCRSGCGSRRCACRAPPGGLDHIVDQQRLGGRRWQVDGVKFMIDGTIDGGTAWLEQPDTHGESHRAVLAGPAGLHEAARYLAAAGVPTVTHAIGDAGVRYVLDALSGIPAAADAGCRTGSSTSRRSPPT